MQPNTTELLAQLPPLLGQFASRNPVAYARFFDGSGTTWFVTEGAVTNDGYRFYGYEVSPDSAGGHWGYLVLGKQPVPLGADATFEPQLLRLALDKYYKRTL